MKRIGMIHADRNHGLMYQRGMIPLRRLRGEYEIVPLSLGYIEHADILTLDAIILFHSWHATHLQLVRRAKGHYQIPVIIDIDDLLSDLPSDHPDHGAFKDHKIHEILSLADQVTVSTPFLRDNWGHLNKNIAVIENCIEERRYAGMTGEKQIKPYHSGFVVGWSGSTTHRPDLYNSGFVDGLVQLMEKYDDVRAYFHILCPQVFRDKFGSRVIFNADHVDYMDWPALCYTFPWDVCTVPLTNHPFNDAKSDLRLLDMAPFKIPIIASPRANFVQHIGKPYMLYADDNPEAWFKQLEYAYQNKQNLRMIADEAHKYVMSQRTAEVGAQKWREVLSSVLSR